MPTSNHPNTPFYLCFDYRYRWAFVSGQNEHFLKPGSNDVAFIPHVTRISQLMDFRYTSHSPVRYLFNHNESSNSSHIVTSPLTETPNEQGQPHHAELPVDQHPPGSVQLLLDTVDALAVAYILHRGHREGHQALSGRGREGARAGFPREDAFHQVVNACHFSGGRKQDNTGITC